MIIKNFKFFKKKIKNNSFKNIKNKKLKIKLGKHYLQIHSYNSLQDNN